MEIRFEGGPWDGVTLDVPAAPDRVVLRSPLLTAEGAQVDFEDELDYLESLAHRAREGLRAPQQQEYVYRRQADAGSEVQIYRLSAGDSRGSGEE